MEHRGVGGVHSVAAVDPAGSDDPDGRTLFLHGAHLHGAGLGAQDDVVIDIECVLGIPGRMVFGDVQGFEVVVIVFHFRAFGNGKAHAGEDVIKLVEHGVQGMLFAQKHLLAGHGHIDLFLFQLGRDETLGHVLLGLFNGLLDLRPYLVGQLADHRPLFGGEFAHAPQNAGEFSLFAQEFHPSRFQLLLRSHRRHLPESLGKDLVELLFHVLHSFCEFG